VKVDKRKQEALEEAIALFEANAEHMNSGPWSVAEYAAKEMFEEMQRGEMGDFEYFIARWGRDNDEYVTAVLCKLAEVYLLADKIMPYYLKVFVTVRLIEPTAVPNIVDGKFTGFGPAKAKRGQRRHDNFSRDNAIINIVRRIKENFGYDAVRGVDKRAPDDAPSAASIVAEAFKIVGIRTNGSGKRGEKSGIDESTVSNLWSKRNRRFDDA
jgi:hypothetical protein